MCSRTSRAFKFLTFTRDDCDNFAHFWMIEMAGERDLAKKRGTKVCILNRYVVKTHFFITFLHQIRARDISCTSEKGFTKASRYDLRLCKLYSPLHFGHFPFVEDYVSTQMGTFIISNTCVGEYGRMRKPFDIYLCLCIETQGVIFKEMPYPWPSSDSKWDFRCEKHFMI